MISMFLLAAAAASAAGLSALAFLSIIEASSSLIAFEASGALLSIIVPAVLSSTPLLLPSIAFAESL